MRSGLKSIMMCSAVLAISGLALAQPATDAKKPAPPANAPSTGKTPAAPPKDAKPGTPGMDQGMEAMMKAGTPGAEHKKLEPMVGKFDVTCKFTMAPGAPEQVSKGTASNTWTLDGRFVQMTYDGDMMGMPFHGTGFMGYNNMAKQFESFWIDSMSTSMMLSTGSVSADGKTFNWSGDCDDPMAGKRVKMRSVYHVTDTGYTMEMYSPGPDGKEAKNGELTFKRTGAAKPEAPKTPASGNTAPKK